MSATESDDGTMTFDPPEEISPFSKLRPALGASRGDKACRQRSPDGKWVCTQRQGHSMEYHRALARDGGRVVKYAAWRNGSDDFWKELGL